MPFVHNNELVISLYHGTSSLFVNSIAEYGLGARNPVEELKLLSFLQKLHSLAEKLLTANEWWDCNKWLVESMVNQESHFRHGSSFLSPSRLTAARYAINNPFGSELLSAAAKLYEVICGRYPECFALPEVASFPALELIKKDVPSPVLVEACRVGLNYLVGEMGASGEQVIQELSSLAECVRSVDIEVIGQQHNFQLIRPLESNKLKLYRIQVIENDQFFPKYELIQFNISPQILR